MADNEEDKEKQGALEGGEEPKKKNIFPLIMMGLVLLIGVAVSYVVFSIKDGSEDVEKIKPTAEYVVKERMFQLKDGSYLRLGFSIVVEADKLDELKEIIEKKAPARLPDGIHMLLGNKTRENLIDGTYKRDAFSREIKKMINEHVLSPYNKQKTSADEIVEAKDVLLLEYVTQSG
jgi:flagellar basal body-associated protein FliL